MSKQQIGRIFSALSRTNLTKQARWGVVKAVKEGRVYHYSFSHNAVLILGRPTAK